MEHPVGRRRKTRLIGVLPGSPSCCYWAVAWDGMDARQDIREFLTSRRAKVRPEQTGLPAYGTNRRVAGLRREEVALLAGISVEYYTRLERGNASGASEDVLEGIARALQLDEAERAHLYDLVRVANTARLTQRRPAQERVRPTVQRILDSMVGVPAYVRTSRLDILAANHLGAALYAPVLTNPMGTPNMARFIFFDPSATEFFPSWDGVANDAVAILRSAAGRDPYDRRLSDLIGELSTRSDEFRVRWAAHNVKFHRTGTKTLHHPLVGDLALSYEALELSSDDGQRILVYTPEPGSPSEGALELLASWTASPEASRPPLESLPTEPS
jgi:MmyB-like transcription regulator ligand binding domain/Helix-turn-helix domain